jgi:antagonist of KipI
MTETVRVLSPGVLTTIQDLGRHGYAHLGVSASGAADPLSARISNRLVGNSDNCSVLEMTLLGGQFEFGCDAVIALAGADFSATLDGTSVHTYESIRVPAGGVLRFGSPRTGARCYLAVGGGLEVAPVLGSTSTHLMSRIGGLAGRALKRGDVLRLKAPSASRIPSRLERSLINRLLPRTKLRMTLGPQHEFFGEHGVTSLCAQTYVVSEDSNRVGLRLRGETIHSIQGSKMLTEGAALGAIQIPRGGEPIILFVEHQTTGGYPKIANVISADLPSVGQLRPRDKVRFELVPMQRAIELLKEQEEILKTVILPA